MWACGIEAPESRLTTHNPLGLGPRILEWLMLDGTDRHGRMRSVTCPHRSVIRGLDQPIWSITTRNDDRRVVDFGKRAGNLPLRGRAVRKCDGGHAAVNVPTPPTSADMAKEALGRKQGSRSKCSNRSSKWW